jgi:hypothetical protein
MPDAGVVPGGGSATNARLERRWLRWRPSSALSRFVLPPAGVPYVEALNTRRYDVGAVGQTLLASRCVLVGRVTLARQRHDHQFEEVLEHDRHDSAFGEVTIRGTAQRNTWVGVAVQRDAYRARELSQFGYTFRIPGIFIQDDFEAAKWWSLSVSASHMLSFSTVAEVMNPSQIGASAAIVNGITFIVGGI